MKTKSKDLPDYLRYLGVVSINGSLPILDGAVELEEGVELSTDIQIAVLEFLANEIQ